MMLAHHEDKYKILQEMLVLTGNMKGSIDGESLDEFMKLMESRKSCIEKIDSIDWKLVELKSQLNDCDVNEQTQVVTEGLIKICEIKKAQKELVKQMIDIDQEQSQRLDKLFNELQGQRRRLSAGRQALHAYLGKTAIRKSVFVDDKK